MLRKQYWALLAGMLLTCLMQPALAIVQGPYIFDWGIRDGFLTGREEYTPVPHPGHDWPASHSVYTSLYGQLDAMGRPLALMLQPDTNPYDGSVDPNALSTVMGYVPRLDFAFADFEETDPSHQNAQTQAMINQVRAHANPNINQAFIGNYNDYPGAVDKSAVWPAQVNRPDANSFYLNSGLNVAMPGIYPYEYYITHTWTNTWGYFNVSPNARSALFWAPLEKYSVAKRNLPAGHLLIPWTARFIDIKDSEGYFAPTPPREDVIAMMQHIRLRGADGYFRLVSIDSNDPNAVFDPIENDEDRMDMLNAWHSLDSIFTGGPVTILNLNTNKTLGLEWSGVQVGDQVAILISNLSSSSRRIALPSIQGLPTYSDYVAPGSHMLKVYMVPEPNLLLLPSVLVLGGLMNRRRCRPVFSL